MSFSLQKLRSLLPGTQNASLSAAQRHSVTLEPEIGFQISIETAMQQNGDSSYNGNNKGVDNAAQPTAKAMLNVHLLAARHLPALFGFKIVHGYLIKVKLFPGTKRLDSSIQTNSWPKFNENFKFPLSPEYKSSLKHSAHRSSSSTKYLTEFTPEELFAGQFVVFTVYALLELPPASFNRFNKTCRSLRDKGSNFVQKMVESSTSSKDDKENTENSVTNTNDNQKVKRKPSNAQARDPMPALTISESRRNIGSVTCYLEPKLFMRNTRTGQYTTEELWLPIKDITTTAAKNTNNNLVNAPKGVVEIVLEVRDLSESVEDATHTETQRPTSSTITASETKATSNGAHNGATMNSTTTSGASIKNPQWNRMTTEMKRKIGMNNNANAKAQPTLTLRVTTSRMRCTNKVKDELEATAGSVYVKTTVFEHGIYVDSWKSGNFYPSLSTKWNVGEDTATIVVPLQQMENLENMLIRTTVATKTKMGKKLVLGTVLLGAAVTSSSGAEHLQLLTQTPTNEKVAMWHSYQ